MRQLLVLFIISWPNRHREVKKYVQDYTVGLSGFLYFFLNFLKYKFSQLYFFLTLFAFFSLKCFTWSMVF